MAAVRDAFLAEGFAYVAFESVRQEIDPSLAAHYERIQQRALSTLTRPVTEEIDLLVLRRPGARRDSGNRP